MSQPQVCFPQVHRRVESRQKGFNAAGLANRKAHASQWDWLVR